MSSRLELTRRAMLLTGAPLVVAAGEREAGGPVPGDLLVRDNAGLVRPSEVTIGASPVHVWAMDPVRRVVRGGRLNRILLLRLAAGDLKAFSALCTHAGCAVSGWNASRGWLLCPCHGSAFEAAQGGAVTAGPAPRPLPSLAILARQDCIAVTASFSVRIGGDTSRTM